MTPEQIQKQADNIRLVITAITIAEYGLIGITGHQGLKLKVSNAINACRRVQDYFSHHPDASEEIRGTFKKEFLSDEIVLLTELLKSAFVLDAESLETLIDEIKKVTTEPATL